MALNKLEAAGCLLLVRIAILHVSVTLVASSCSSTIIPWKFLWIVQYSEPDHQEYKTIVMPLSILKVEWTSSVLQM